MEVYIFPRDIKTNLFSLHMINIRVFPILV